MAVDPPVDKLFGHCCRPLLAWLSMGWLIFDHSISRILIGFFHIQESKGLFLPTFSVSGYVDKMFVIRCSPFKTGPPWK
jgi:hypothetical protein